MRAKWGIALMSLGTALILAAAALMLWNQWEDRHAGSSSMEVVNLLETIIHDTPAVPDIEVAPLPEDPLPVPETAPPVIDLTMKEVEIDGHAYIGYLSVPAYDLKLPVMSQWSYPKLKTAPCRYTGALLTDDLVIMAHNFPRHFGKLKDLPFGSSVAFTDMDGFTTVYQVVEVETMDATAIEEMTDGRYDLTLFTCTYGGEKRIAVRCDRLLGN